ncbi:MAG: hypothetical protein VZQ62_03800 [Methanosphaera sp.]|nr:hypothetical protein [Methanosphaera sp.]
MNINTNVIQDAIMDKLDNYFNGLSIEKLVPLVNTYVLKKDLIIKLSDCLSDDQMDQFYKHLENLYLVNLGNGFNVIYTKTELLKSDWFKQNVSRLKLNWDKIAFDDIESTKIQDLILTLKNIIELETELNHKRIIDTLENILK